MSYRIDYSTGSKGHAKNYSRKICLCCIFFAIFIIMVCLFWPEGKQILQVFLIPGEPDVTLNAAEVFAQDLSCGVDIREAAKNLCFQILGYETAG